MHSGHYALPNIEAGILPTIETEIGEKAYLQAPGSLLKLAGIVPRASRAWIKKRINTTYPASALLDMGMIRVRSQTCEH